mmetsp:Transcript_39041/g.71088  ORF Transcript_39041/g.71088 Transcript_39041/m.71088 type:complete len:309 (-) Transcript_39041:55-981(-)
MRPFARVVVPVLAACALADQSRSLEDGSQPTRARESVQEMSGFLAGKGAAGNDLSQVGANGGGVDPPVTAENAALQHAVPTPSDFDCQLCGGPQRWVFIVGTPESGARGVLNMLGAASPFIHIAGENGGVVSYLRMMRAGFSSAHQHPNVPLNSWQHSDPAKPRRILCSMQRFVQNTLVGDYPADTKILGFKEVRHSADDLDMFLHIWPCAQFIVTTRANITAQEDAIKARSEAHGMTPSSLDLRNQSRDLRLWAATHHSQTFHLPLEHFSVDKFNELLQWLGVSGCSFTTVKRDAQPEMTGTCRVAS